MERKIGDRFNLHETILEVCKSCHDCTGCYFLEKDVSDCPNYNDELRRYTGPCFRRKDGELVVFKEVSEHVDNSSIAKQKIKTPATVTKSIAKFVKFGCDYVAIVGSAAIGILTMLTAGTIKSACYTIAALIIGSICEYIIKRFDNTGKEDE